MAQQLNKISILSNPRGGYNKRTGLDKIKALSKEHNITHIEASTPDEILNALRIIEREAPDILVINGGDGTIDIVLRQIRTQEIFTTEPIFALLKGGTTNMIHRDSGLNDKPHKILNDIIRGKITNTIKRNPLKVEYSGKNNTPLYGFFLGTGAIPKVILEARKGLHKKGLHGPFSEFLILSKTLCRLFFKRNLSGDKTLQPTHLALNGQRQDHIFLALSSLRNLIPFVKSNAKPTHAGLIHMDNNKKLRRSLHDKITLKTPENWVLDGEMHEAGEIEITLDTPLQFLSHERAK